MFLGRKFHLQTGVTGPANAWSPLHYVPLRLACGNPSIPGAVLYAAQTAHLLFPLSSVFVGYNRHLLLPGALSGFTCSSTQRRLYSAQTAHLLFPLSSVFVGYNRRWLLPGALSGFTCSSTRRRFIHRANRALVFFAFFCFRRLEPTLAFAGCSLRSYLFQYSAQSIQKK